MLKKNQNTDSQAFWDNFLSTDELKVELFGRYGSHYMWHKANTALHNKSIMPAVKHSVGLGDLTLAVIDR